MIIGFFGNGSLGWDGAVVRDGTVADRLELFRQLERLGHGALYLAPRERTPDDPRVVGYRWRGRLDALVVEARDQSFAPPKDLSISVDGLPAYEQAVVLGDWAAGRFGTNCRLLVQDFDLRTRRVLGIAGRHSLYEQGAQWRARTPWMADALEKARTEGVTCLVPYEPEGNIITEKLGKVRPEPGVRVERFDWCYPQALEVPLSDLPSLRERTWDLVYSGSDYDRRRRLWELVVRPASELRWRVVVTGVWGDRRQGREAGEWREKGFRTRVERETEGLLTFLSAQSNAQAPFGEMLEVMRDSRMGVQLLPDEYRRIGYRTNRVAELAAAGVVTALDAEIERGHEWWPTEDGWRVKGVEDMGRLREELRGWDRTTLLERVRTQRELCRSVAGTGEQLVRILEGR